jgi:hypothetical protein
MPRPSMPMRVMYVDEVPMRSCRRINVRVKDDRYCGRSEEGKGGEVRPRKFVGLARTRILGDGGETAYSDSADNQDTFLTKRTVKLLSSGIQ